MSMPSHFCPEKKVVVALSVGAALVVLLCQLTVRAAGPCVQGTCGTVCGPPAVPCPGPIAPPRDGPFESDPPAAVVRIVHETVSSRSYVTGVLLARDATRGVIVTVHHAFREGTGAIHVSFPADGVRRRATLSQVDPEGDLAAIVVQLDQDGPAAMELTDRPAAVGEAATFGGYGPVGRFAERRSRVLGYGPTGSGRSRETLLVAGAARWGDSGGPVLDQRGRVLGILWGTDGRTVYATYAGRVRRLLALAVREAEIGSRDASTFQTPEEEALAPFECPEEPSSPAESEPLDAPGPPADVWERLRNAPADKSEAGCDMAGPHEFRAARAAATDTAEGRHAAFTDPIAWLVPTLTALGWSAPPSAAALVALRLVLAFLKRTRPERNTASGAHLDLHDGYARELAGVFAHSGRSTAADAALGRDYEREIEAAERSTDPTIARFAKRLREQVTKRFHRICTASPVPADPVED